MYTINETEKAIDILVDGKKELANCTIFNESLECTVTLNEKQNPNQLIKLDNRKQGEIKVVNINVKNYSIPLKTDLEFISSYYNTLESNQYFSFILEAKNNSIIPLGSKLTLDILKDNISELATCFLQSSDINRVILSCKTQTKISSQYSKIFLNNKKSKYSSITLEKLSGDQSEIYLNTTLTVNNVDNLYFNSTDKKWSFHINVGYPTFLLENSKIIVDLIYNNTAQKMNSTSTCRYHNKGYFFLCFSDKENQTILDSFYISTTGNKATVKLEPENKLDIIMKSLYNINVVRAYDLFFNKNNKWEFILEASKYIVDNYTENLKSLDINISNSSDFAYCKIDGKLIKCQVESRNQNKYQLITLSKHKKGEIKINNIDSDSNLNKGKIPLKINLEFISSYYHEYFENQFPFKIEAFNNSVIPEGSILSLDLIKDGENKIIFCKNFYINSNNNRLILSCSYENNQVHKNSVFKINNQKSNYSSINWNNKIEENKLEIPLNVTLEIINSTNRFYNSTSKKWNFEMNIYSLNYKRYLNYSKILINLIYNNKNETSTCRLQNKNSWEYKSYSYYYYNIYKLLCTPDNRNQTITDKFEISKEQENIIYCSDRKYYCLRIIDLITINAYQIYDLTFSNNKWNFAIESMYKLEIS